ncbi:MULTISPECIES: hypothetical protein [unclassified Micromonospora]|uniref:hypothetical protein n=1 Tax=unclassified Micromonospora TaxID=2617518 RepID=UPI002FF4048F
MSTEARTSTVPAASGPRGVRPVSRTRPGADEVGKMLMLVNATLVGVPSAYLASGSLAVTALTVATACLTLIVYLWRGRPAVP